MSRAVLLDASPLGMLTHPRSTPENDECKLWLTGLAVKGFDVIIPEIADYEVRRELLRAGKERSIARLDAFKRMLAYAPITTSVMLRAANFWAAARNRGRQSADDTALDADMILSAQAVEIAREFDEVIIPTTNVRHLTLFAPARHWREIG